MARAHFFVNTLQKLLAVCLLLSAIPLESTIKYFPHWRPFKPKIKITDYKEFLDLIKAPLPPINSNGAALFSYVNESSLADDLVFIQVIGENPKTGAQCFIKYDSEGNPSYFDVDGEIDSALFAYPLSDLPLSINGSDRHFYLPPIQGGRIYTSLKRKMVFSVVLNDKGVWTICAPNPLNVNDPNKDLLWDKTEYTVDANNIFINPTAVDDFSLPLHCEETGQDGSCQSGGIEVARDLIFNEMEEAFKKASTPWPNLISNQPSLIFSPMFAAATGVIPNDFFVTSGWIDAFKVAFSEKPLFIDASESFPPEKGGGIWSAFIHPETLELTFKREVDKTHPVVPDVSITLPTKMNELLAGSGPSWNIETSLQAVFARNLSCAIDTNTLTHAEALSMDYFKKVSSQFYEYNALMPADLQFIDHYSKVLHSFGNHQIYTLPYDDELSQSGSASYTPQNYKSGVIKLGRCY